MGKHTKRFKAEKAKVKLKASKRLPKGTNVTDTNFKIKQIVIREQLKVKSKSELVSKRKLNIKELLSRLQHHNTTAKKEAITDLKELVSLYPKEVVEPNLCQLIQGICHLVLDREKSVRLESLRLIALILAQVSEDQVAPFFDILSSYFRCSMTHIDTAIQEDSLHFLDTLLTFTPSLVVTHSSKILENFFDLISKLRTDSKPGRTLTVNLNSKLTTVKWRIKVLGRLHSLLKVIVKIVTQKDENRKDCENLQIRKSKTVKFTLEDCSYFPVYQNEYIEVSPSNIKSGRIEVADVYQTVSKYIDIFVPLLFETWLEVGPSETRMDTDEDIVLSEEAREILNCILNILHLLQDFLPKSEERNNFMQSYKTKYFSYIISHFPYTKVASKKPKRADSKKPRDTNFNTFCIAENLMACHVFFNFFRNLNERSVATVKSTKKMMEYIHYNLVNWYSDNEDQSDILMKLLELLLLKIYKPGHVCKDELKDIFIETIFCYNRNKMPEKTRFDLFNLLAALLHDENLNKTEQYQTWLSTLPELLCKKEISERYIDVISLLAKRNNAVLTKYLTEKFEQILENLRHIKITETQDENEAKLKIIGLLSFVPFQETIVNLAVDFIKSDNEALLRKYMQELLIIKYLQKQDVNLKIVMSLELKTNEEPKEKGSEL